MGQDKKQACSKLLASAQTRSIGTQQLVLQLQVGM
jgi:hypothetical protein